MFNPSNPTGFYYSLSSPLIQRFIRIIILPQNIPGRKPELYHKNNIPGRTPLRVETCDVSPGTKKNTLKRLAGSGSGIPEYQLSFFLINNDLLIFIYFSFQNHFWQFIQQVFLDHTFDWPCTELGVKAHGGDKRDGFLCCLKPDIVLLEHFLDDPAVGMREGSIGTICISYAMGVLQYCVRHPSLLKAS